MSKTTKTTGREFEHPANREAQRLLRQPKRTPTDAVGQLEIPQ